MYADEQYWKKRRRRMLMELIPYLSIPIIGLIVWLILKYGD